MSKPGDTRIERDSMGEVNVPAAALWGAQTQRAVDNFRISDRPMPAAFIHALGEIKAAAAVSNTALGLLDKTRSKAIRDAALAVADGQHDDAFPVDTYQTGSGTSSNMNANEVIATLASRQCSVPVHPNDHVNMSQSSNDVIPTALHFSAAVAIQRELQPAIRHLCKTLAEKRAGCGHTVKTGRTHLMDAMPLTLDQELGAWQASFEAGLQRIDDLMPRLCQLAQGGTAVGTGINAHPEFGARVADELSMRTGLAFRQADNLFSALAGQETALEASGALKTLAASLMKLANDLRWMNAGPLAGLGEIRLPAVQPGSSIMPGKVNPVLPEAAAMVAASVFGNDTTITVAAQSGNFQLNVMLPLIASRLLESIALLSTVSRLLADSAIADFAVQEQRLNETLSRNPVLVTALNPVIGYELGARIAKAAYDTGRPVREVALEMTDIEESELDRLLDPAILSQGGLPG